MPFSWYHAESTADPQGPAKAQQMYEQELGDRAARLLRLGFSKKDVLARLTAHVQWDFELHAKPAHMTRVKAIVDQVFKRKGVGAGAPTI
ncbi:MAG: hypothetical protein JRH20_03835 [Deltaproteobacteria bacterium]|nr:hypothetical protein [Deltaproteobacteria bacterium]